MFKFRTEYLRTSIPRCYSEYMPKKAAQQKSGWKSHQSRAKIKKQTKIALIVLGCLIGILLLATVINFIRTLASPPNSTAVRTYAWDKDFNLNLIVGTKDVSLITYKPKEKEILVLKIPQETYIDLPNDFGKWQLRSVYELGENTNIGGQALLKSSLSSFLGLPVDAFSSENLQDLFRQNFFSGLSDLPKLQTDLTYGTLLTLKRSFMKVRFDHVKEIDLRDLDVLDRQNLADGTEVFIADPIRLDSVMAQFSDPSIALEHASIAIFNATDRPLLAQKAKRLVTNLGGNVIVTQNGPKAPKSYVEGPDLKTTKRLSQIFDLGCSKDPNCVKIPKEELGLASLRAQIIVVLGQDFP